MLVSSPKHFLLGDLNVHVWVGGLDEDGVVRACAVEFSVDVIPLELDLHVFVIELVKGVEYHLQVVLDVCHLVCEVCDDFFICHLS